MVTVVHELSSTGQVSNSCIDGVRAIQDKGTLISFSLAQTMLLFCYSWQREVYTATASRHRCLQTCRVEDTSTYCAATSTWAMVCVCVVVSRIFEASQPAQNLCTRHYYWASPRSNDTQLMQIAPPGTHTKKRNSACKRLFNIVPLSAQWLNFTSTKHYFNEFQESSIVLSATLHTSLCCYHEWSSTSVLRSKQPATAANDVPNSIIFKHHFECITWIIMLIKGHYDFSGVVRCQAQVHCHEWKCDLVFS